MFSAEPGFGVFFLRFTVLGDFLWIDDRGLFAPPSSSGFEAARGVFASSSPLLASDTSNTCAGAARFWPFPKAVFKLCPDEFEIAEPHLDPTPRLLPDIFTSTLTGGL